MNDETFAPKMTIGELVRSLLGTEVAGILRHDPIARRGGDPEGVHQLRVCARRLRSELRVVFPALKPASARYLSRELKWLGGALGAQRDLYVLVTVLTPVLASANARTDSPFERLDHQRADEFHRGLALLNTKRYRNLVRELASSVLEPPLRVDESESAFDILKPGLTSAMDDLCRLVDEAGEAPSSRYLHQVRIAAKRARYAAVVATPVLGNLATRLAHSLEEVQSVLGELHDRVVAIEYLQSGVDHSFSTELVETLSTLLQGQIKELASHWRAPFDQGRATSVELLTPGPQEA